MIRIVTDTTSDILPAEAKALGVELVPLRVVFDKESFREGFEITMEAFYERLATVKALPTTSQPPPDDFLRVFGDAKAAGDSVVAILLSSALSGTYQSAVIAKELCGCDDIHVIDSRTAIVGLRLLVEHAVKLRDAGQDAREIAREIEAMKERVVLFATLDTLEYLYLGGRLSRAGKIAGMLLGFKPVITLRHGTISVVGKGRGVGRAIESIFAAMDKLPPVDRDTTPVYFGYTAIPLKCVQLIEAADRRYGFANTRVHPVGAVIGAHAGPGACVIVYLAGE